ncbi:MULTISPECIES: hypothetical protein [Acinetobacter]|uniref:hypothetical protein n=1 Tax=Acinetobacter TaxID=469 RepID=UPI001F1A1452|nr:MULTISPECIES: hypothetical protein [Acinetobacter]MDQ9948731.1 hypothetical protein [Acinetobacter sp. 12966]
MATTKAVAAANFRRNAKNYPIVASTIKDNGERTERLSANTKFIIHNTEAISRVRTKYSEPYRSDQWQGRGMSQITTNYESVVEKSQPYSIQSRRK